MTGPAPDAGPLLLELAVLVIALAVLARLAARVSISPIPLYLVAGLALGTGGIAQLGLAEGFVQVTAEIGLVLLMFMLGLEFTSGEFTANMRRSVPAGLLNAALNFTPGVVAGLALGWDPVAALLLGGVTYNSSSGLIAKVLSDLGRVGNRETPAVLSLLVFEDLTMAAYLPLMAVLLVGTGMWAGMLSVVVAVASVMVTLFLAVRHGEGMSRLLAHRADEVLILTILGLLLLVAATADLLQVSGAVGAFLLGIALSGEIAERSRRLLGPLRDLFAATFFLFFSFQLDPAQLPTMVVPAIALAVVTAATKVVTGWWAAGRAGAGPRGRFRAGGALVARGEFAIVVAGIGVAAGVEPQLGPLATAYVLLMAIAGPLVARSIDDWAVAVRRRLGMT